ncbi:MAG: hypothetical protein QW279_16120 [Candidatus Jordarchaeaceae archaeon]
MSKGEKKEFTVKGEFDSKSGITFTKIAIGSGVKFYGPIFKRMTSLYALEFESRMLNEKPSENMQGLDEVIDYITNNLSRYPRGHCSLIYGMFKAESKLQGFSGAGAKRAAYTSMKSILEITGILNKFVGTTDDAFDSCKKASFIFEVTKIVIPMSLTQGEGNQLNLVFHDCPYKDACVSLVKEKLTRLAGGWECAALMFINAGLEIIKKKTFDYKLDEFNTPNCTGKIWEV